MTNLSSNTNPSFISKAFIGITKIAKPCMRYAWQFLYNQLAEKDSKNLLLFMNYGYSDNENEENKKADKITLKAEDEAFRYPIQLYAKVIKDLDLRDKTIAEIGCGRGGGGAYLLRYADLHQYIGIDLSAKAIKKCKLQHNFNNAEWLQGNAENLPIDSNTVDILINVESSHCYPSMLNFLNEAYRVLKKEGQFAFCDLRPAAELATLENQINISKFKILDKQIITPQIISALDKLSQEKEQNIISKLPKFLQPALRDFMATKNSAMYNAFVNGEMAYVYYLCSAV